MGKERGTEEGRWKSGSKLKGRKTKRREGRGEDKREEERRGGRERRRTSLGVGHPHDCLDFPYMRRAFKSLTHFYCFPPATGMLQSCLGAKEGFHEGFHGF